MRYNMDTLADELFGWAIIKQHQTNHHEVYKIMLGVDFTEDEIRKFCQELKDKDPDYNFSFYRQSDRLQTNRQVVSPEAYKSPQRFLQEVLGRDVAVSHMMINDFPEDLFKKLFSIPEEKEPSNDNGPEETL